MVCITGNADEGNVVIYTSDGIAVMSEKLDREKLKELFHTLSNMLIEGVSVISGFAGRTFDPVPPEPKSDEWGTSVLNWLHRSVYDADILLRTKKKDVEGIARLNKINGIKRLRDDLGIGLKEAKDLVEAIMEDAGI